MIDIMLVGSVPIMPFKSRLDKSGLVDIQDDKGRNRTVAHLEEFLEENCQLL